MICPICKREVETLHTAVRSGQYFSDRCGRCLLPVSGSSLFNRKYERDRQREDYRKDLIQNWEPEFAREYPQQALDAGWSEEDMRKHG